MSEIPDANTVTQAPPEAPAAAAQPEEVAREPLTEEEIAQREADRTELVRRCRDFIQSYIEKKAPGKIRYRANVLKMNNSYIFRYSPPAQRGQRTRYFSQVVLNRDTGEFRLEYFRPQRHDRSLWYFPIYYMMNGFTKNPKRTFQALGLEPVETSIRNLFQEKGYTVQFYGNRQIGNVVYIEWPKTDEDPTTTLPPAPTAEQLAARVDAGLRHAETHVANVLPTKEDIEAERAAASN